MNGYILFQVHFIHPTKGAKEVAQSSPKTFASINMYLSNSVSIIIPCPNTFAWSMVNGHMYAVCFRKVTVCTPFI